MLENLQNDPLEEKLNQVLERLAVESASTKFNAPIGVSPFNPPEQATDPAANPSFYAWSAQQKKNFLSCRGFRLNPVGHVFVRNQRGCLIIWSENF